MTIDRPVEPYLEMIQRAQGKALAGSQPKPTIPDVLPEVVALYQRNSVGCCLHIVLDDDNVLDSHVQACVDLALEQGHLKCYALAKKLLLMSKSQRHRLYRHPKET